MEQNEALALKAQQGDREALAQLWKQVKGFAILQCCRYTPTQRVSREDLIQCAYLGVHWAALHYDPARGAGFLTFMIYGVRRECSAALGLCGKPRIEADCSLDAPVNAAESDLPLLTLIADDHAIDINERIGREQLRQAVSEALTRLPEKQAASLKKHFFEKKSCREIAEESGVTKQRIHEILMSGIRSLREDKQLLRFLQEYGFDQAAQLKGQLKGKRKNKG